MDAPKNSAQVWSKAYPAIPRDTLVCKFHNAKPFIPSYERDCSVNLNYLLCYEYYRIWQREITERIEKRQSASKPKKMKRPNFDGKSSGAKKTKQKSNNKGKPEKGKKGKKVAKAPGNPPAKFETCICA